MRAYSFAALPLFVVACASASETDVANATNAATATATDADADDWDGTTCDGDAIRVDELHRLRVAAGASDTLGRWSMRLRYQDCDRDNGCGAWHEDSANASGAEASDLAGTAWLEPHPQLVGSPTYSIALTSDATCKLSGAGSPIEHYTSSIYTDFGITNVTRINVPRSRHDYPIDCRNKELPLWLQGAENKVTDHCFRVRTWGQHNIVDSQSWRAYEAVLTARW